MYKILDLFAGAGGLSLGFEMTEQFKISAIVENNKYAARTYIENHSGLKNYNDILKIDFNQILKEQGKVDVVIGGPPCQGFSNANRQRRKLINGSNELVKKYVEAIKELEPDVFVMENVKTIASDKHFFCLTRSDEEHLRNNLHLNIHDKDVVLYEGENVNDLMVLINNNRIREMILLNEGSLYFLKNAYKKREKLKAYLSKATNNKVINNILKSLVIKDNYPEWYNELIKDASNALGDLIKTYEYSDNDIKKIKRVWNVQRLFHGLVEMEDMDAIYDIIPNARNIVIQMKTYIVIDYIKKSFEYLEYKTEGQVLNAASFGVPQNRERYILIGMKKKLLKERTIELPMPLIVDQCNYVTVKRAISDLEKYVPTINEMSEEINMNYAPTINNFYSQVVMCSENKVIYNHVCTNTREEALKRFEYIGQGENFHSLPVELKSTYENPERTQNTIYKRLSYDQPSETVVNVRKSMWIHPVLNRAISAREAARLQSFPDSYKFVGTKDSVYQQIGNAVPPLMGRAVAEKVLELLGCSEIYTKLKDIYDNY